MRHATIAIATDGAGNATAYSPPLSGIVDALKFNVGTLGATTLTVTDDESGLGVLSVAGVAVDTAYQPRGGAVTPAGSAIANSAAAVPVAGRLKVVASGGASKAGSLDVWLADEVPEPH